MKRKIYIQILGVLSCLAVVVLHTNGCFWDFSYERYWLTANLIENLCYFAVPIFFMISGATLMDYRKRYSTEEFFKKRFWKTVVPFLIWSVVGIVWMYFNYGEHPAGILDAIQAIGTTKYVYIYWFFPALFSVYLAMPLLSCVPEKMRKRVFAYAIAAYFIVEALLPLIFELLKMPFNSDFCMPAVAGYLVYTLLGYWISHYELSKKVRIWIYVLAVCGLLIQLLGTQVLSLHAGEIVTTFKGYKNVPCILYSVGVFTFFRNLKTEKALRVLDRITAPFSKMTFGIYLIHWYFIQTIIKYQIFPVTSIWYRILGSIGIFLLSAGIVKILQMIPVIKRAIPS